MTSSIQMADYLGRGLHADRPANPGVPATGTAIYYETDTTNSFVWSGSAWLRLNATAVAPTIVQQAGVAGTAGPVTLPAPPTPGNLLFAMTADFAASSAGNNGYFGLFNTVGSVDGFGYGFRIAQVGDTAVQNPNGSGSPGSVAIWEIAGGAPGFAKWEINQNTAFPNVPMEATESPQLYLGYIDMDAAGLTILGTTNVDHTQVISGGSRTMVMFDYTAQPGDVGGFTSTVHMSAAHNLTIAMWLAGRG